MNYCSIIDEIYISGYIDGDGCFSISKNISKRNCSIVINSTNRNVLIDFVASFGGCVGKPKTTTPKNKPIHRFEIGSIGALDLAKSIIPYLIEKKSQCLQFISYFLTKSHTNRSIILAKLELLRYCEDLVTKEHFDKIKDLPKSVEPTENDYIYLAGFIDAECNLGIQYYKPKNKPNKVYKTVFQLNNSKHPIFYWIKERFGGSVCYVPRHDKDPNRRDQIHWKITGKALHPILKRVHPYLRYKKPVCEKLIEFHETTLKNGGARHTDAFRESYSKVLSIRESIVSEVHKLNLKGSFS